MLPSNVAPGSRCPRRSQTSGKNEKYYLYEKNVFKLFII